MKAFKPKDYNSVSPYLIVDNAAGLIAQLKTIFNCKELRTMFRADGKIAHCELMLDDSVIMISDSNEDYPAMKAMLHAYVQDVKKSFKIAIDNGCELIDKPINKNNDPDMRGSFYDIAGNYWSISTQL